MQKYQIMPFLRTATRILGLFLLLLGIVALPVNVLARERREIFSPNLDISGAVTWGLAGSPYVVAGDLNILSGGKLIIEPGVEVQIQGGSNITVRDGGELSAVGNSGALIKITLKVGDSNFFRAITFEVGSKATLAYCDISQAGFNATEAVIIQSSNVTINHCTIHDNNASMGAVGLYGAGLSPTIQNTTLKDNANAAITQSTLNMTPSYSNLVFSETSGVGFDQKNVVLIGGGGILTYDVELDSNQIGGYPFVLRNSQEIGNGGSLLLHPGALLQLDASVSLTVQAGGVLTATGALAQPVVFTRYQPTQNFGGLIFQPDATVTLDHCQVSYGGQGVQQVMSIASSQVTIDHCILENNTPSGQVVSISGTPGLSPILHNTTIRNNTTNYAIFQNSINLTPNYANVTIANNSGMNALVISGGSVPYNLSVTLSSPALNGSPIIVLNGFAVEESAGVKGSLTLSPGTLLKIGQGQAVTINGILNAIGTQTQPVTITSQSGTFSYIQFNTTAQSHLAYCDISNIGASEAIKISSSNVLIEECLLHDNSSSKVISLLGEGISPQIRHTTIRGNGFGVPIYQSTINMTPRYESITLVNNSPNALVTAGGTINRKVTLNSLAFLGLPIYHDDTNGITVSSTGALTMTAGTELRMSGDTSLRIENSGSFYMLGEASSPVTLTARTSTNFSGLEFSQGSTVRLAYCDISHAGKGVSPAQILNILSTNVRMNHCNIHDNRPSAQVIAISGVNLRPVLHNTIIQENRASGGPDVYAIYQNTIDMKPDYENLTFLNNGLDAIGIGGGSITTAGAVDVTLDKVDINGAYFISTGAINIENNTSLTILAGTALKFTSTPGNTLRVQGGGRLDLLGTLAQPVSISSTGATQYFSGLEFFASAIANLSYCDISQAGLGVNQVLNISSSDVNIDHCIIHDSQPNQQVIQISGQAGLSPSIRNTVIRDNQKAGVVRAIYQNTINYNPTFQNVTLENNDIDALVIEGGTANISLTLDGPALLGSPIILTSDPTIDVAGALTITPGTKLLFAPNTALYVQGGLHAVGTPTLPITFTAQSTNFRLLEFRFGSRVNLAYCDISQVGVPGIDQAIVIASSGVTIDHCRIHDTAARNQVAAILGIGVSPAIQNTLIENGSGYAIAQNSVDMTPVYLNLTFRGNGADAVYLNGGTLSRDVTLDGRELNGAYFIAGDVYVPNPYELTLQPGTEIRFEPQRSLVISGGALTAVGTPTQTITLRAVEDQPLPDNHWGWLNMFSDAVVDLAYCEVSYGGRNGQAAVNVLSSKVDIRSCYIHHNTAAGVRLALNPSQIRLENLAVADNFNDGVYVGTGVKASLVHLTVARNGGNGVYVNVSGSVAMTNTIMAGNTVGVALDPSPGSPLAAALMNTTLWDSNGTEASPGVVRTGDLFGPANFAEDGYHITRYSADALDQGISTMVNQDIDAEGRPLPAGTAPDLGADEYIFNYGEDFAAEKAALHPKWFVWENGDTGVPLGRVYQSYVMRFFHGAPALPGAMMLDVGDAFPAALEYETSAAVPAMSFAQQASGVGYDALRWQSQQPLQFGETGAIQVSGSGVSEPWQMLTNQALLESDGFWAKMQASAQEPVFEPLIVTPRDGSICTGNVQIKGAAQPGVTVTVSVNSSLFATLLTGSDGTFATTYNNGAGNPLSIEAQACTSSGCSTMAGPVTCGTTGNSTTLFQASGTVFDVTQGLTSGKLTGITVTLMISNPGWGGWAPWPAVLYAQDNPKATNANGRVSFNVPAGSYYFQAEGGGGYQPYRSPTFEVVAAASLNLPLTPWIGTPTEVLLTGSGPLPQVITVTVGRSVEWLIEMDGMTHMRDFLQDFENPVVRLLSSQDPQSGGKGWDSGMLTPVSTYKRQFTQAGSYTYTDGMGHSGTVVVRPLAAPVMSAPSNGTITYAQQIQFEWQQGGAESPDGYQLVVSGVPYTTTANSYSLTLAANQVYAWNVRAFNENVYSPWASATPWTVEVVEPAGVPVLLLPVNGAVITTTQATAALSFTWSVGVGGPVVEYELQVGAQTYTLTGARKDLDLAPGVYAWKVRAGDKVGYSAWSEERSLEIKGDRAGVPVLLSPQNGYVITATQATIAIQFTWSAGIGGPVVEYELQVGTQTYVTTDTQYQLNLAPGVYSWKVRAQDNFGYSAWSEERSLEVKGGRAGVPVLLSPQNGYVVTATQATVAIQFAWSAGIGSPVLDYELQVGTQTYVTADTQYSLDLAPGVYSWKVRARDNVGYSAWSEERSLEFIQGKRFIFLPLVTR